MKVGLIDAPTNKIRDSWNEWSDTWYRRCRTEEAIAKLIAAPSSAFHPTTYQRHEWRGTGIGTGARELP
ncbi:hypothetical protein ACVNS2_17995 [Paenibacillus caseinilyticus]|uniref:Methyltransferase type 11 n=1 Tax=Paenibacillus mucilaginosus (strain KNP414) TaxID=1036673 RepID=F8FDA5_PAEMK|nr:hypothetical protein [Paenibacillus mucilaginosus]AEI41765.1 Methyltransferase type 11 [Paenibacillus mucilaginosus KNP414]WFA18913.1 hypothetical protein ERY13_17335 [Paenibacillus mucilaginosus]